MNWFIAQITTPSITIPSITLPSIVVTLVIASLCGLVAQVLVGFSRVGCIASLVVGIIGALVGQWLAFTLHAPLILPVAGIDVVWTVIGSAILAALLALSFGGTRYRRPWFRRGGSYRRE